MENSVTIKSVSDETRLTFSDFKGESFTATLESRLFSGRVVASTYLAGLPSLLFNEIAREWRGWEGKKQWSVLEDELHLTATSDHTGHIYLQVIMRDSGRPHGWRLEATLQLEAGQLEALALDVSRVFPK
jgi:hypothetical protein